MSVYADLYVHMKLLRDMLAFVMSVPLSVVTHYLGISVLGPVETAANCHNKGVSAHKETLHRVMLRFIQPISYLNSLSP